MKNVCQLKRARSNRSVRFFLKKWDMLLDHIPHGGVWKLITRLSRPESIRRTDHVLSLSLSVPRRRRRSTWRRAGPLLRPPQGPLRGAAKRFRRRQRPDVQHPPPRQPPPHEPRLGSRRIRSGNSRARPPPWRSCPAGCRLDHQVIRSYREEEEERQGEETDKRYAYASVGLRSIGKLVKERQIEEKQNKNLPWKLWNARIDDFPSNCITYVERISTVYVSKMYICV